jgi:hypothetical protein
VTTGTALRRIISELDTREIPHMVAGSFAAMAHGLMRMTHDIDLIVDPTREQLDQFVSTLTPEEFYVSPEAADEAWRRRGQFNVIDMTTGWKTDLILIKRRPFSREEFSRRRAYSLFDVSIFVATAEDTILSKLEWAKLGESDRQLRDVAGIFALRRATLDRAYIERWAPELGVSELWERVQLEAAAS